MSLRFCRSLMPWTCAVVLTCLCAGQGAPSASPSQVAREFLTALIAGDGPRAKALATPSSAGLIEAGVANLKPRAPGEQVSHDVLGEFAFRDRVLVRVQVTEPGTAAEITPLLVRRIQGAWRVDFTEAALLDAIERDSYAGLTRAQREEQLLAHAGVLARAARQVFARDAAARSLEVEFAEDGRITGPCATTGPATYPRSFRVPARRIDRGQPIVVQGFGLQATFSDMGDLVGATEELH